MIGRLSTRVAIWAARHREMVIGEAMILMGFSLRDEISLATPVIRMARHQEVVMGISIK